MPVSLKIFSDGLYAILNLTPSPAGEGWGEVQTAALKQTLPEKRKLDPLPNPLPWEREQITAPSTFSDGIGKETHL
ncbi:hypothetical protein [Neisseria meningitidis]|uniref:hypothetical protein n=1 Tax=Neisseria meningitidis TaxID=487 RepID=UPI0018C9B957|nr:hypothetical protein [Neisseria meningitidis]MBG8686651.1 hypothetical protein [Neisseria meningitidis]MBG8812956.1 hypothetical protein [Neisseria meningitidis]MBG9071147.1 hypothetical protein [Neisseria meningitidis]MBG9080102.1 hypothetical protein [Neisseria meningitidis]MBG9086238.1 hypothetical protein [Neisseria meningitidis]